MFGYCYHKVKKPVPVQAYGMSSSDFRKLPNSLPQGANKPKRRRSHVDTKMSKGHPEKTQGTPREI